MKFYYKKYGHTLRPVIPIVLAHSESKIGYEVLVDSGADLCIFDQEIGEAIGLDVRKGTPHEVFGVGGKASVYFLHEVEIKVGGWPFIIKAGFMPRVAGRIMPYGIVGQAGFFENFVVKFDLMKEEIEIKQREELK